VSARTIKSTNVIAWIHFVKAIMKKKTVVEAGFMTVIEADALIFSNFAIETLHPFYAPGPDVNRWPLLAYQEPE
jgi:hypothetical protein